jgi:hypothetical protein
MISLYKIFILLCFITQRRRVLGYLWPNPALDFRVYDGYYEKIPYDISLKTGELVMQCWPNAGGFHEGEKPNRYFEGCDVAFIQPGLNFVSKTRAKEKYYAQRRHNV